VHIQNRIIRHRPIAVTDTVGICTHAENLREHRSGLLVDVVSRVSVGHEPAWDQVTTFLHQQRTSMSGEPKTEPPQTQKLPPPSTTLRISPRQIRRYASIGADHNPIHTSRLGAKVFGFPRPIAHGMFSAAAVLANIEGQLPDAVSYAVKFGKPVFLPSDLGVYIDRVEQGWDIALRDLAKGHPHLTASVRSLP
jgi:acyl dehydratase